MLDYVCMYVYCTCNAPKICHANGDGKTSFAWIVGAWKLSTPGDTGIAQTRDANYANSIGRFLMFLCRSINACMHSLILRRNIAWFFSVFLPLFVLRCINYMLGLFDALKTTVSTMQDHSILLEFIPLSALHYTIVHHSKYRGYLGH